MSSKPGFVYIKPVEGRLVREPVSMLPLPDEGMWVHEGDMHWQTLINFGDVELAEAPPEPKEPEKPAEPAAESK